MLKNTWRKCAELLRTLSGCLLALVALTGSAFAQQQIVVSNYGIAANGMPYAIAMKKEFFRQEGANVSGVLSSNGGGTTVRNLLEGSLPYGEGDLAGTVLGLKGHCRAVGGTVDHVHLLVGLGATHTLADFMRTRQEVRREVQTLSAEGRMSGYVLFAIPLFLVFALEAKDPSYLDPMLHGAGLIVLIGTAGLMALGFWIVRRMVNIKI